MIDLSRTCGTATSLICYALVMLMIYSWIKIKLKVLIYLSQGVASSAPWASPRQEEAPAPGRSPWLDGGCRMAASVSRGATRGGSMPGRRGDSGKLREGRAGCVGIDAWGGSWVHRWSRLQGEDTSEVGDWLPWSLAPAAKRASDPMTSGLGRQRKWAAVSGQVGDAGASGRGAAGRAPCGLIFFQDLLIAPKDTSLKFKKIIGPWLQMLWNFLTR
jgi:hypothetical protein